MTSTYSRVFDVSYDPITGSRVLVQGKLIKEYLHVEPRKMLVIEDQVKPQVRFCSHGKEPVRLCITNHGLAVLSSPYS